MSSSLNLVFCGTPAFAVPTLAKLVEAGFSVPLVVTQPDRPRGRGMELAVSPVKQTALRLELANHSARKNQEQRRVPGATCRDSILTRSLSSDTAASFRSGCSIFRRWAISICTRRCCRSIAARRRFSGPLRDGETVTGVTTMRIDAGLDTGDILLRRKLQSRPTILL